MKTNYYIDLSKHLIKQGPKFCSQKVIIEEECLYVKSTFKGYSLSLSYLFIGVFLFLIDFLMLLSTGEFSELFFFLFGIASMLCVFTLISLRKISNQGSFDKHLKKFRNTLERSVLFENILSFQINDKKVLASGGELYPCYEFNMLTANGRRINILNHNDLAQMREDAQVICEFMGSSFEDFTQKSSNLG